VASLKQTASSSEVSPLKLRQQQFWAEFCEFCKKKDPGIKLHKPAPQHWLNFSMGNSIAHLAARMNTQKNHISMELYIPNNKMLFSYFKENEETLLKDLGKNLDWFNANIASGFNLYREVNDVFSEANKLDYFEWLYSNLVNFKKVLIPYIQEFKIKEMSEE
jgi:hypothetical protein